MSAPRQGEGVILPLSSGHVPNPDFLLFLGAFGFSQGIELSWNGTVLSGSYEIAKGLAERNVHAGQSIFSTGLFAECTT